MLNHNEHEIMENRRITEQLIQKTTNWLKSHEVMNNKEAQGDNVTRTSYDCKPESRSYQKSKEAKIQMNKAPHLPTHIHTQTYTHLSCLQRLFDKILLESSWYFFNLEWSHNLQWGVGCHSCCSSTRFLLAFPLILKVFYCSVLLCAALCCWLFGSRLTTSD